MFCPQGLRMNLSQYQDNPSLETGTTFSAGTLGRRSGKDNTRTTGGIAPKAILMVWRHVRSNGHYHYVEAILVLDWMAPASSWQRRQGRWGTCQDCEKRWTLRGRLPRRRGWDLNRTWCHPIKLHIWDNSDLCVDMFIIEERRRKMTTSANCPNVSHEKWVFSEEGQLGRSHVRVGKVRRRRRHVCAIFQACCACVLPVDTQVLYLHFAVKIHI